VEGWQTSEGWFINVTGRVGLHLTEKKGGWGDDRRGKFTLKAGVFFSFLLGLRFCFL
jgi:hypothetical protein